MPPSRMSWAEFQSKRQKNATQLFTAPGATPTTRTIMVCSHIWWTEQMALALLNLGYNVLLHFPLYLLYTDDSAWANFDVAWNQIIAAAKQSKSELLIGGNSAALAPHPKTGQLLHEAAGIPVVHYWWDELRHDPPIARRGFTPDDYMRFLKNERTLNLIWDIDVLEELAAFHQLTNTAHLPLATLPDYWPSGFVPVEQRPLAACFLGNCHYPADWVETDDDPLVGWARNVASLKITNLDRPMRECIDAVGPAPSVSKHLSGGKDAWMDFRRPWEVLNSVYMHRTRNVLVQAAANHLKGRLALIGKGWDQLGLRANSDHAGDKSGMIYAQSQASLNLFGGCVHGGMPLRPFDIGASGGVLVTHYQRELPRLFEVDKECVAFRTCEQMIAAVDRILASPEQYTGIAQAGRKRVLAEHTWEHRMQRLVTEADARFRR